MMNLIYLIIATQNNLHACCSRFHMTCDKTAMLNVHIAKDCALQRCQVFVLRQKILQKCFKSSKSANLYFSIKGSIMFCHITESFPDAKYG